jgi:hypothetical protein
LIRVRAQSAAILQTHRAMSGFYWQPLQFGSTLRPLPQTRGTEKCRVEFIGRMVEFLRANVQTERFCSRRSAASNWFIEMASHSTPRRAMPGTACTNSSVCFSANSVCRRNTNRSHGRPASLGSGHSRKQTDQVGCGLIAWSHCAGFGSTITGARFRERTGAWVAALFIIAPSYGLLRPPECVTKA